MDYGTIPGLPGRISRLVMGTMVCTTDNMELTRTLLDAFVERGGTCLDTAYVYAGGKSECAIGEWMRERGNRERIILIDKGAHPKRDSGPRVNPEGINEDIRINLERLQTDCIDLWLLHRDDPGYPVGPIVDCLNEHQRAGRIRAFGGSNWTVERIQEANEYARVRGLSGFVASSPNLSLAAPNEPMWGGCVFLGAEGRAWHERTQFPLLPWSAQASGFFTGRYSPDNPTNLDVARVYYSDANWERFRRAGDVARRKGATANQVALAWVLRQPFPVYPLVGPRTVEEMDDTFGALSLDLTHDEMRWLNLEA